MAATYGSAFSAWLDGGWMDLTPEQRAVLLKKQGPIKLTYWQRLRRRLRRAR